MLTGGQLNSLSTGGGAVSPTACDFEPNSWLNLLPIDGLESDDAPNMLPPPHPERTAPTAPSASATRRWRARPAPMVRTRLLRIIKISPKPHPFSACAKASARWRLITARSEER